MPDRILDDLTVTIGVLRHPCDLDLLLFFHRHPNAILASERLAAYVGYPLDQLERSLDVLHDAGLLERSQDPRHAARMYVLKMPLPAWSRAVLEVGAAREGRRRLLRSMKEAAEAVTAR